MRHVFLSCVLICCAGWLAAFEIEDQAQFGPQQSESRLRIISTADIAFITPMIESFMAAHPETGIDYIVASSTELMGAILDAGERFDLAISSAMDLQTKLANDGLAQRHNSAATQALPGWAVWNDMLFAFTQEPAAMVLSKAGFEGLPIPKDRQDLITLLRQHPERFRGRVGTYDVRLSGLGYLFATQDTRASETYWRLAEVMGRLAARLYCCSSDMIEAVETGELLIAYNVLGSYAMGRVGAAEYLVVLPSDFTTVMLRTVLIPHNAPAPEAAQAFVDHLLTVAHDGSIPQFDVRSDPDFNLDFGQAQAETALNRIRIGPGLLVYLDQLKQRAFLSEWENAILQD